MGILIQYGFDTYSSEIMFSLIALHKIDAFLGYKFENNFSRAIVNYSKLPKIESFFNSYLKSVSESEIEVLSKNIRTIFMPLIKAMNNQFDDVITKKQWLEISNFKSIIKKQIKGDEK